MHRYFFELDAWMKTGNLFSYLPDDTLVVSHDNLSACHDEYYQQIQARHHSRAHDKSLPIMPPDYLFLANNEFHQVLKAYPRVVINTNHDTAKKLVPWRVYRRRFCRLIIKLPSLYQNCYHS